MILHARPGCSTLCMGLLSGCREPRSYNQHRINILLIMLDTTRADHLGCYGHTRSRTPNIDRLAAEGTMFRQCLAAPPTTLPSHASIMTGNYPFVHGVWKNVQHEL